MVMKVLIQLSTFTAHVTPGGAPARNFHSSSPINSVTATPGPPYGTTVIPPAQNGYGGSVSSPTSRPGGSRFPTRQSYFPVNPSTTTRTPSVTSHVKVKLFSNYGENIIHLESILFNDSSL